MNAVFSIVFNYGEKHVLRNKCRSACGIWVTTGDGQLSLAVGLLRWSRRSTRAHRSGTGRNRNTSPWVRLRLLFEILRPGAGYFQRYLDLVLAATVY